MRKRYTAALFFFLAIDAASAPPDDIFARTRENGKRFEEAVAVSQRVLKAWLAQADPKTLLLPDRPVADHQKWIYTPHNSARISTRI